VTAQNLAGRGTPRHILQGSLLSTDKLEPNALTRLACVYRSEPKLSLEQLVLYQSMFAVLSRSALLKLSSSNG
jgi:hypothetical protein